MQNFTLQNIIFICIYFIFFLYFRYFFPTYENDSLLCALDEDEDEEESDATRNTSTPIIAEDTPISKDSILLTDEAILQDLKHT